MNLDEKIQIFCKTANIESGTLPFMPGDFRKSVNKKIENLLQEIKDRHYITNENSLQHLDKDIESLEDIKSRLQDYDPLFLNKIREIEELVLELKEKEIVLPIEN
jgi:protein subunit release factor A